LACWPDEQIAARLRRHYRDGQVPASMKAIGMLDAALGNSAPARIISASLAANP
jgi:hypothetical protein